VLVPHLRNRPFTMKRSPYGVAGDTYFQKQAPKAMPSWIPTRTFRTYPRGGGSRLVDFPLVNSPEALLWMVHRHERLVLATSRIVRTSCSSTSTRPTAASRSRSASRT
jgi:DNA primase